MTALPPPAAIRTTCAYCGVGCGVLARPDGAGGLDAEDAWSPSVGRKGHRSGAMAAVARSIQPNTPSPR